MHWYEHGDVRVYESGKPFIWDEYESIICLCLDAAEVRGSNPRGPTRFIDIKPNRSIDQKNL
jgi:hypothetical protein